MLTADLLLTLCLLATGSTWVPTAVTPDYPLEQELPSMANQDEYYDAAFVALAMNFSEQIFGAHEDKSEDELNEMFLAVMKKAGHAAVDLKKLDHSIQYFLTDPSAEDIYSLPEYSASLPESNE